ncbi:glycosyltransferase family 2 protein [Paenibacillus plantiphilus]|nr:glycosyltransferase family 2 protein [Paenibacillus plantiphilus]
MKRKRRQARMRKRSRTVRAPVRRTPRFGHSLGFDAGYGEGLRSGQDSFGTLFEGTSIIIPSFNQVDYLKQCIDSINDHTDLPYEIIVVDNASEDGTDKYLQRLGGQIRYRILERNRGFAGAVNIGMMMAKGNTILLLNNDTVVTDRWLNNMLDCINSDPTIGMVGPVTNYISGDQRIEVPYRNVAEMQGFAQAYNVQDRAKWQRTDRLTGFCLLFRRDLWERTGYLDEGYAVGNYEDDDYNIRVRLQGYSLVITRDTFIHHYGSVSMKALGERFMEVNDQNLQFYVEKWGNPHELVHRVKEMNRIHALESGGTEGLLPHGETIFFPQSVIVRGTRETLFWIENGIRRPIIGVIELPVVRLSQVDLRRWPIGEAIGSADAAARWHGYGHGGSVEGSEHALSMNGLTAVGADGSFYVVENGKRRRAASRATVEQWGLQLKPQAPLSADEISMLAEGFPIIAPVRVSAQL